MNAAQTIVVLINEEMTKGAADRQRVLRNERMALELACQSGDPLRIKVRLDEAKSVARMWGVKI